MAAARRHVSFKQFISNQTYRLDIAGDLARDMEVDGDLPSEKSFTLDSARSHLIKNNACKNAMLALNVLYEEWLCWRDHIIPSNEHKNFAAGTKNAD